MKNYIGIIITNLLLLFIINPQQDPELIEDVNIELLKYAVNENLFGGATIDCSTNPNDPEEKRFRVYFAATFGDFSTKKTMDFNNISLVDTNTKMRYRPSDVYKYISMSYNEWFSKSIPLEEYKNEDTFLKYSQEGITDYDFYVYPKTLGSIKNKNKSKFRYRIEPDSFKKKSGMKFAFSFPAFKSRKDTGNFKIYWKDKMIGEFKIVNGKASKN